VRLSSSLRLSSSRTSLVRADRRRSTL
jgi:hypothetical protein